MDVMLIIGEKGALAQRGRKSNLDHYRRLGILPRPDQSTLPSDPARPPLQPSASFDRHTQGPGRRPAGGMRCDQRSPGSSWLW